MSRLVVSFLLVACLALAVVLTTAPAAAGGEPVTYRSPVDAPVRDPFRAPAHRYGPGNRGVEYDTELGERVEAAAPGIVRFAGQVAGRRYVTVLHADGVRTTYGPLARIAARMVAGAEVGAGQPVGTSTEHLLWTARIGTAYVDPAVLVAASGTGGVRLVADRAGGRRGAPAMLERRLGDRRAVSDNFDPGRPTVARR